MEERDEWRSTCENFDRWDGTADIAEVSEADAAVRCRQNAFCTGYTVLEGGTKIALVFYVSDVLGQSGSRCVVKVNKGTNTVHDPFCGHPDETVDGEWGHLKGCTQEQCASASAGELF